MSLFEIYAHIGNSVLIFAVAVTNLVSISYALKRIRELEKEHDHQLSVLRNATIYNTKGTLTLVRDKIEELEAKSGQAKS